MTYIHIININYIQKVYESFRYFDKNFEQLSYLKLMKGLFTQVFGTPRNHPKSKPFHDHIMCFYWPLGFLKAD